MALQGSNPDQAIYVISVAAELAGVHPQTLRVYERKGLLTPQRTQGNTRRYSDRDIDILRKIQDLTQEGLNLSGVLKVLDLESEIEQLRDELRRTEEDLRDAQERLAALSRERPGFPLVPFRDVRRVRRALKSDAIEEAGRRRVFAAPPVNERTKHDKR